MSVHHILCPVHAGAVHGEEAEEMRSGIEILIEDGPVSRASLQDLLDRVDARDSLAHVELLAEIRKWKERSSTWKRLAKEYYFRLFWSTEPYPAEIEVDEMFDDEPRCKAATHGPRNSRCTCEDSRDE